MPDLDAGLVAKLDAAFTEATSRQSRVRESYYRMAGKLIRLRVVGDRLADSIESPFAHLRVAANNPHPILTLDLWHEAETSVNVPQRDEPTLAGPYSVMSVSDGGRFIAEHRRHSVTVVDRRKGRMIVGVTNVDHLYIDERARPLQRVLAIWLGDLGVQRLHAGLVAKKGLGALFVGRSGSGKSTSSIACLLDGFSYLGDDYVGVSAEPDGSFSGYGVYGSGLIDPNHMRRFPELEAFCASANHPDEDKHVLSFCSLAPGRLEAKTRIGAIVLPRVVNSADTRFRRASAAEAMFALAPSSVLCVPGAGPRSIDHLARLVERVPAYWLELGRDVRQIPQRVDELLQAG